MMSANIAGNLGLEPAELPDDAEVPSWLGQGFIKDGWAAQCEPLQRPFRFLWIKRKPFVGMRTETNINLKNSDSWCHFSGIITSVGPEPTDEELKASTSELQKPENNIAYIRLYFNLVGLERLSDTETKELFSQARETTTDPEQLHRDKKAFLLENLGALHGQQIQSYAVLNFDFAGGQMPGLPFEDDRKCCFCNRVVCATETCLVLCTPNAHKRLLTRPFL